MKLIPRNNSKLNKFKKGGFFKVGGEIYYPSQKVIDKILEFESWHEGWIDDGKGNLTTGWGFKYTPLLKKKYPKGMTKEQANNYLKNVIIPEKVLELKDNTPNFDKFNQNQKDALFDYIYNTGVGFYTRKSPKLLKALEDFDFKEIVKLMDADYNNPKFKGAKKRREWEWELFNTPMEILIPKNQPLLFNTDTIKNFMFMN